MNNHFTSTGLEKKAFSTWKEAEMQYHKFNANINNLGERLQVAYRCKICNKIHLGRHYKKIITFKVQEEAKQKIMNTEVNVTVYKSVNEILNKFD